MNLLDGKVASAVWKYTMAEEVKAMVSKGQRPPHLCAILVGNNGASETYVASKVKNCAEVGFHSSLVRFEDTITEEELLQKIKDINNDDSIDGLIVQLPLPPKISVQKVTETISPAKDVDGFHPINTGRMLQNLPDFFNTLLSSEKIISYGGLTLITIVVFAETGLFIGFFLPGDYLLFTSGLLCATKTLNISIFLQIFLYPSH